MLRRGTFPILSEQPLDESEPSNTATAKVFVIEVGAYSDRYIDAIFTTRELAEAFVADRQRRAFEREGRKAHREIASWLYVGPWPGPGSVSFSDGVATSENGQVTKGEPQYRNVDAETFEEFMRRHTWNEFGDVEEYDLWDMIPVVPKE